MEITAKIAHPVRPSFITTIRYIGRLETLKKQAAIEQAKKPYAVLDPRTGAPFFHKGEPLITWRADLASDFAVKSLAEIIVGWEGLSIAGKEIAFSLDNLDALFETELDTTIDVEIEENDVTVTKNVPATWARALERKAYDRKVFDRDPFVSDSAKS